MVLPVYLLERIAGAGFTSHLSTAPMLFCNLRLLSGYSHNETSGRRSNFSSSAHSQSKSKSDKGPKKGKDAHSYSDSLLLPKTAFPLRADAAKREKLFRKRTTADLYSWQAEEKDRPLFVLHDGPPYANGNLHIGHALNKILKDVILRSKLIQGNRVHYVPGYDTHGLPLELKALSALKAPAGSLTPQQIREAARKEAEKGVAIQGSEFLEFGGIGAFGVGAAYRTMDWSYEKRQLGVVREMVRKGLISTHHRPTLYSPSSRTALAEAELEYKEDHLSRSVYVAFPVSSLGALDDILRPLGLGEQRVDLAVWTTTAWTLPGNVAIAVSSTLEYSIVKQEALGAPLMVVGTDRIADLESVMSTILTPIASFTGDTLLLTTYTSPLDSSPTQSSPRPIITASYVTSKSGTSLVHTAPAHGVDDWNAWRSYLSALDPTNSVSNTICAVDAEGKFSDVLGQLVEDDVRAKLEGKYVLLEGTEEVIRVLEERGTLLKEVAVRHKFPYDWRTKKPVIFRVSSQWFANLEKIHDSAVKALEDVAFYPSQGRKVLEMYVRGRSEWCISRQRAWGVPLPVVYSYPTDSADPIASSTPYLTPSNIDHITSVLDSKGRGTDYWWEGSAEEFVEPAELERSKAEGRSWRKGVDTLDVWFDSGVSWTLIRDLDLRPDVALPFADVYLEGTDQHRGWFQSSLLTAISASEDESPKAPYGTVITHGMVLDDKGRKMSKSLGNVISPLVVIHGGKNTQKDPAYGVDLLRVWVSSVDSSGDVPIGPIILSQISEALRKIRNTARFMLGNLNGEPREAFEPKDLGLIERYVLNELYLVDQKAREGYNSFSFNRVYQALVSFSNTTLSSFYFDICKDSLYADARTTLQRRQVVFTLQQVFDTYLSVLAPMAPHLAEEIYHFAKGATQDPPLESTEPTTSVFQKPWIQVDECWNDPQVKVEMDALIVVRDVVMELLEQARRAKQIGSSMETQVVIRNPSEVVKKHAQVLKTLFIVSDVQFDLASVDAEWGYDTTLPSADESAPEMIVSVLPAPEAKCPRCWTYARKEADVICSRCQAAVA